MGIETENILEFTETMAQMGTATNLAGEEGAKTLARFMNVTGTSQDQVKNLGSAIVELGNNFATSESEIASLAMRMGFDRKRRRNKRSGYTRIFNRAVELRHGSRSGRLGGIPYMDGYAERGRERRRNAD